MLASEHVKEENSRKANWKRDDRVGMGKDLSDRISFWQDHKKKKKKRRLEGTKREARK